MDSERLRQAPTYREFLAIYLEDGAHTSAELARRAGFARGFPADVIAGKRRLTSKSFLPIERALRLPVLAKRLFRLLVLREEKDVLPEQDRKRLPAQIEELRKRPWQNSPRREISNQSLSSAQLFRIPYVLQVYAAAGEPGRRTSFETIQSRCRLSDRELKAALDILQKAGLLHREDGLFEPRDLHLYFDLIKAKPEEMSDFQLSLLRNSAQAAVRRLPEAILSHEELFFASSFCVKKEKLADLKQALKKQILEFVDEHIDANGESVANVFLGFHL